jgi:hypothetical protein
LQLFCSFFDIENEVLEIELSVEYAYHSYIYALGVGSVQFKHKGSLTMALPVVEFSRQGYKIGKVFA